MISDGSGRLYGIDYSQFMVTKALKKFRQPIQQKKIDITLGDVCNMPYPSGSFDRVYHCNCYYFWPDPLQAATEIYRVMRPGAFMVTTVKPATIEMATSKGFFKYAKPDTVPYMHTLETAGFVNVHAENVQEEGQEIIVMYAYVEDKSEGQAQGGHAKVVKEGAAGEGQDNNLSSVSPSTGGI